jgi:hypothetical protein
VERLLKFILLALLLTSCSGVSRMEITKSEKYCGGPERVHHYVINPFKRYVVCMDGRRRDLGAK